MELPLTLLNLAGSVALLLWGIHMVQTGVQRAFGAKLRNFLAGALRNRLYALLAGIGVTALLQSSTATGIVVANFAANGLVGIVPALAVMLGANIGTTLIVQLLSFNVAAIAPVLILLGVMTFRRLSAGPRDFGRVLIGLGLLLMALRQFVFLLEPYEDAPSLRLLLAEVASHPLVDVILAAGLTWMAHSSVAIVLLVMSFAAKGVIPPHAALALVLGANLGTAINPVLESNSGEDPATRRVPAGNFINRLIGVSAALLALPWISPWLNEIDPDAARRVADFHTVFNIALAVVFFPFLNPYASWLCRLLPSRAPKDDPGLPQYLSHAARETPVIALGAASREALRLPDLIDAMLAGLDEALTRPDRRGITEAKQIDSALDRLTAAIKTYLIGLDPDLMDAADHKRFAEILTFISNLELAGNVLSASLLADVGKAAKRGIAVTEPERGVLLEMIGRLRRNAADAASLFMSGDERAARLLVEEKEIFRDIETKAIADHFGRLRDGGADAAEMSRLNLNALADLKRVNTYLVTAAAYPVLEEKGELLRSRLRQEDSELPG
jgi:phosphate:Na+ symporter